MKKQVLFLCLSFFLIQTFYAQCPLSVGVSRNPIEFVCKDVPVTYTATPLAGATNPQYIWVVDGDTVGSNSILINSSSGEIIVYMTSSACPNDTASQTLFHKSVYYEIDFTVILEECDQEKADVQINEIISFGGTPPYTYELFSGEQNLGQKNVYTDLPTGNYPILVTDANGCQDTVWINAASEPCPELIPSEIITPNDDGFNDTWKIANIEQFPDNEVHIFDRWGQRVYRKEGYDNADGWDAKYAGVGLPVSTYYYVIRARLEKSEDKVLKGAISIFR